MTSGVVRPTTPFLGTTNSVVTTKRLRRYLKRRVTGDDTVYVINSQVGSEEVQDEERAVFLVLY